MIHVKQFRYSSDNLAYLLHGKKEAMAVDGGAAGRILSFVEENGLTLKYATNTHGHPDHTVGTAGLVKKSGAEFIDHRKLAQAGKIELEGFKIDVASTPGHTNDSVSYYTGKALVTGDTLFNGTVGNCFSGDLDAFYRSIKLLLSFPDETLVYAGHDYVRESVAFARKIEPDNPHIEAYLEKHDPCHVCSTLADERKVNPFVRFNEAPIAALLKRKGLPVETERDRWFSVMTL